MANPERRVALIHRVIVPDEEYPKEYAVLVTDRRSIFVRLRKTRSSFVLRGEMRYGTALVTDVVPKTLDDYEQATLESLTDDSANLTITHEAVISLEVKKEVPRFRARDLFIWLTMRRQGEIFQVYHFDMTYRKNLASQAQLRFYMVPLGAWFKPRRQTQTREAILLDYAAEGLRIFQGVLPTGVTSSAV